MGNDKKRTPRPALFSGLLRFAAPLSLTLSLGAVSAASALNGPDYELAPTSEMMVQSIASLVSGGHDETNYRARSGSVLKRFAAGAGSYTLFDTGASQGVVRLAVKSQPGPIVILVHIPAPPPATVAGLPAPTKPYYALATLIKTRLTVYAFYDHVPDSGYLTAEIADTVSGGKRPLAIFDPKFVASTTSSGPDRYILK